MSTINGAFNAIWRVAEPRPLMVRLMTYWMILTIGPLLLGASLSLSSYGFVSAALQQGERAIRLTQLLPFLLAAGAFTLLSSAVPARAVAFHPALTEIGRQSCRERFFTYHENSRAPRSL